MPPHAHNSNLSPNLIPSPDLPIRHDHHRAPSLGQLHQELESEQEGQVNRLLGLIREQQAQIQTHHPQPGQTARENGDSAPASASSTSSSSAIANPRAATPSSVFTRPELPSRSRTPSATAISPPPFVNGLSAIGGAPARPTAALARQHSSRTPLPPVTLQQAPASPTQPHRHPSYSSTSPAGATLPPHALRPRTPSRNSSSELSRTGSMNSLAVPNTNDLFEEEVNFCRTETASLERQNRMLKARIEELESQLTESGRGQLNSTGRSNEDAQRGRQAV